MKYYFTSKRVKKLDPNPKRPDYHNIIEINKRYFTLTGWLNDTSSDIRYSLEEVTPKRLLEDKYLNKEFDAFMINKRGNTNSIMPKADKHKEGDTCRRCSKGTLRKKDRKSNRVIKPNQTYIFKYVLQCDSCKSNFNVESAKVMLDQ